MTYNSRAFLAGSYDAPVEHTGERVYMREIMLREPLPPELERWDGLVYKIANSCRIMEPRLAYLMIDQTVADEAGMTRRPGWHIDGYWSALGQRHSGHTSSPPRHRPIPAPRPPYRHGPQPHHSAGQSEDWSTATFEEPEMIALWSDVGACLAWSGDFEGPVGEGGSVPEKNYLDADGHMIFQRDSQIICGNVTMLHTTLPIEPGRRRTVVRLNIPGVSP